MSKLASIYIYYMGPEQCELSDTILDSSGLFLNVWCTPYCNADLPKVKLFTATFFKLFFVCFCVLARIMYILL